MIDLSKMKAPGDKRPTWRDGIIQIHITRACDLSCIGCTQGSNLAGKPVIMTVENFENAVKSLSDYYGVVGIFGGNPCVHPRFEEICLVLEKYIAYEHRGLWSNNLMGHGSLCRRIFNPAVSNLNVHANPEAIAEFNATWPEANLIGQQDSRHSPPFVAMKDLGMQQDEMDRLIEGCDINQLWSAMICQFRGELRAFFCELAGAQSMLHEHEADYPDTGIAINGTDWWKLPMKAFQHQVNKHCYSCGIPLRGIGDLAVNGTHEYVSETHKNIYNLKKPTGKTIHIVKSRSELNGSVERATDYIKNGIMTVGKQDGVKVLIGIPTAEMARRADFYDYFNMLDKPVGTGIAFIHGQSPARGRNMIIEQALEHNFTHVLFVDDDVVFKPEALITLLGHNKDIVSGLYVMRNFPHTPIIFDEALEDGRCFTHYLSDNESGLVPIVASGAGFLLIKTDVFRQMSPFCPQSNNKPCWFTLGELEKDHWCDDISFFLHARNAGISDMWVDLNCLVGHMAQVTVWPNLLNGKWQTTYDTKGPQTVSFPQITMAEIESKRNEVKAQEMVGA